MYEFGPSNTNTNTNITNKHNTNKHNPHKFPLLIVNAWSLQSQAYFYLIISSMCITWNKRTPISVKTDKHKTKTDRCLEQAHDKRRGRLVRQSFQVIWSYNSYLSIRLWTTQLPTILNGPSKNVSCWYLKL